MKVLLGVLLSAMVTLAAAAQSRPVTPTSPRVLLDTAAGRITVLWEQPDLTCPPSGTQNVAGFGVKVGRAPDTYPAAADTGQFDVPIKCVWSSTGWTQYWVYDRGTPGVRYYFRVFAYNRTDGFWNGRGPDTPEASAVFQP